MESEAMGVEDRIDACDGYSAEYKLKLKEAFVYFQAHGYVFTMHGLNRAVSPKTGRGKQSYSLDDILYVLGRPVNYLHGKTKTVKYYSNLAMIQGKDNGEVVSVVYTDQASSAWEAIEA